MPPSSPSPNPLRTASIYIERLKYVIFPIRQVLDAGTSLARCDCTNPACKNIGKHPRISWAKKDGSASMWERWPNDGFGIATGKRSGIWVLDVDPRNGGDETLALLEQKHAVLPPTIQVTTGSGGTHYYFKYPGIDYRNTAGKFGRGLDTRGDGGYVVAPGSIHKTGRKYMWKSSPAAHSLADVPAWLLRLVEKHTPPTATAITRKQKIGVHTYMCTSEEAVFCLQEMTAPECTAVQWMRDNPDEVHREVWRGLAINLAGAALGFPSLMNDARRHFHEISAGYNQYNRNETEYVFTESIAVAASHGPMSWIHMVREGMPLIYAVPIGSKNLLHSARLAWLTSTHKKAL